MNAAAPVLRHLRSLRNPRALRGMGRFGINVRDAYGIKIPELRKMANSREKDHLLALQLWNSGIHEARILAGMVDDPGLVTEQQADRWVGEFDSWDLCDQVCLNLFVRVPFAYKKCVDWSRRDDEFAKRAAFALMACLAVHDKVAPDASFVPFLRLIERESIDDRTYVKKAVSWALRQIGKRNLALNRLAVRSARQIQKIDTPGARWVSADALRELCSGAVQNRLRNK